MNIVKTYETESFPEWAVCYFANGDASGLDAFDIKTADSWWESMLEEGYTDISFDIGERNEFCAYPEFGLACSTVKATVMRLV